MSMDISMYTRDRPVLDERQNLALARDGAPRWEAEVWRYGKMRVEIRPYEYEAGSQDALGYHVQAHFEERDEPVPDWTREIRWELAVSGSHPDDDFFDWFRDCAGAARGFVLDPYTDAIEEPAPDDAEMRARVLLLAARPLYSEWDDRLTDLRRRGPDGALLAPEDHVYGTDLATLAAGGLRLSWDAAQYVARCTAGVAAPRFIVIGRHGDDMIDGPPGTCARAIAALTAHPDPLLDALLRDPDPLVLRDALIARGEPIAPLLHALVDDTGLPLAPLPDSAALRDELVALWERVIALEPLLDLGALGVLTRPRFLA